MNLLKVSRELLLTDVIMRIKDLDMIKFEMCKVDEDCKHLTPVQIEELWIMMSKDHGVDMFEVEKWNVGYFIRWLQKQSDEVL